MFNAFSLVLPESFGNFGPEDGAGRLDVPPFTQVGQVGTHGDSG